MSKHLTDISFQSLGLDKRLIRALDDLGYTYCTPIQAKALPLLLQGIDVAGKAQTGTGKTATFLLAIMHDLLNLPETEHRHKNDPRAIIMAPTRELAIQIYNDAINLGKYTNFKCCLAYGGEDWNKQANTIEEGVDILIGTTGRLIDFYKQHIFSFYALDCVVLDEADRMFDLGFIADIRYLFRRMPQGHDRFNMLFSATMSHRVNELAYEHMNNPKVVSVDDVQVTSKNITETLYYPENNQKIPLLIHLIREQNPEKGMIFANTKRDADLVWRYLKGNDFKAGLLTGDVPQNKRNSLLSAFKEGKIDYLVATDVAARGLHIDEVSHVFNYDLPDDAEDYVHRIGRTGRAGATGVALSFACEDSSLNLPAIEEYIGHSIPVISSEELHDLPQPKPALKPTYRKPTQRRQPKKQGHHKR